MGIHERFNGETSFHYLLTRLTTVTSSSRRIASSIYVFVSLDERSLESIKLIRSIYLLHA